MAVEVSRDAGSIEVRIRRGFGWGIGAFVTGGVMASIGLFMAMRGEHLPHMPVWATLLWSLGIGLVFACIGVVLTRHGDFFRLSANEMRCDFFRWRFIHWSLAYPRNRMTAILITQQRDFSAYQVFIEIQGHPNVLVAPNLQSEAAWKLASMIAEPGQLPIREE